MKNNKKIKTIVSLFATFIITAGIDPSGIVSYAKNADAEKQYVNFDLNAEQEETVFKDGYKRKVGYQYKKNSQKRIAAKYFDTIPVKSDESTFMGWYTKKKGGVRIYYWKKGMKGKTLYAHWKTGKTKNIRYYSQLPLKGINYSYNGGSIRTEGCGITCLAMVASYYGVDVTPAEIANTYKSYPYNTVNTHDAIRNLAKKYGLRKPIQRTIHGCAISTGSDCDYLKEISRKTVKKYLKKGYAILVNQGKGPFAKYGHYTVMFGIRGNKATVYDPASKNNGCKRTKTGKGKAIVDYDLGGILKSARHLWIFAPKGEKISWLE